MQLFSWFFAFKCVTVAVFVFMCKGVCCSWGLKFRGGAPAHWAVGGCEAWPAVLVGGATTRTQPSLQNWQGIQHAIWQVCWKVYVFLTPQDKLLYKVDIMQKDWTSNNDKMAFWYPILYMILCCSLIHCTLISTPQRGARQCSAPGLTRSSGLEEVFGRPRKRNPF